MAAAPLMLISDLYMWWQKWRFEHRSEASVTLTYDVYNRSCPYNKI
jgi:hypothetical protein